MSVYGVCARVCFVVYVVCVLYMFCACICGVCLVCVVYVLYVCFVCVFFVCGARALWTEAGEGVGVGRRWKVEWNEDGVLGSLIIRASHALCREMRDSGLRTGR